MEITLGQHPAVVGAARRAGSIPAATSARSSPIRGFTCTSPRRRASAPAACVVVEDSVPGCTAAGAAGMRCFGYAPDGDGARLAAVGAKPFHAMADLPALIGV